MNPRGISALTPDQCEEIKRRWNAGMRQWQLAPEYGVSASTIAKVTAGTYSFGDRRKPKARLHRVEKASDPKTVRCNIVRTYRKAGAE